MNTDTQNIPEINTIDINSAVTPTKKKGRPRKQKSSAEPTETATATASMFKPDPVTEKKRLQEELMRLSDYNADVVTKPVNDKVAKLVEEMDIEELKARIRVGKRKQSSKMDNSVAEQTILMCNQLSGRMLGCLEELNETSLKDELLKECTKEYLCLNVLDFIPHELKIGGLYGAHLASAYYKASAKEEARAPKTPHLTELPTDTIDPVKLKKLEEKFNSPEMKDKLQLLKEKFSALSSKSDE